jgi:hypothetical protein
VQLSNISGDGIGQGAFHVIPDELIRIEFGSIGRQKLNMKSRMPLDEPCHTACTVHKTAVPKKDHMPPEMVKQVRQELDHLGCTNVAIGMKPAVQSQPMASGRDGEDGNGRDLGPISCAGEDWRLPPGSPGSCDGGHQQEARLVKEAQVGSKSYGFFLCGATHAVSNTGLLSRFAPGRVDWVSGNSIPSRASVATHWGWCSGQRILDE